MKFPFKVVSFLLSVLVVCAHTNCIVNEHESPTVAPAPTLCAIPLGLTINACGNESGCICRGAVVVESVQLADVGQEMFLIPVVDEAPAPLRIQHGHPNSKSRVEWSPPPLCASGARVLLQSLQI